VTYHRITPPRKVANVAGESLRGRIYKSKTVVDSRFNLVGSFDESEVLTHMSLEAGASASYEFYEPGRRDYGRYFDSEVINKVKSERRTFSEIDALLGCPTTVREGGARVVYTYMRGKPLGKLQALHVSFDTNMVAREVSCPRESSTRRSVSAARIAIGVLEAVTIAARGYGTGGYHGGGGRTYSHQTGAQIDARAVGGLQIGRSTVRDVQRELGIPDTVHWREDGSVSQFSYCWSKTESSQAVFSTKRRTVSEFIVHNVIFDEDGVLLDVQRVGNSSQTTR